MQTAYVVDAVRSPIGRYGGALSSIRPDDLFALMIKHLLLRNPSLDPTQIEDVIAGDANQAGEDNRNLARMSALLAGLPVTVPGNTVNRLCASGMQAIMDATRGIMCGDGEVYIAGGVESMTRAPFILPKSEGGFSRKTEIWDSTIGWRFPNPALTSRYYPYSMGETAENVARQWRISREEQDLFALGSQEKYFAALHSGKWSGEIIPVAISPNNKDQVLIVQDEHPRPTSLEKLSGLRPAFAKDGTVTAGNSSGINDGAAAVLLCSEKALLESGLKPICSIKSMAVAGVDPSIMGIGPVPASLKALSRAGLKISDLDLIELNEAFAVQAIACMRDLEMDPSRVNQNGGAIALGHPLGCSGARITTTLIHQMLTQRLKWGMATMCVGVGQGAALILERVN
ncbi:MAG: thiolase family protein [Chitinophagaceae bacterium]